WPESVRRMDSTHSPDRTTCGPFDVWERNGVLTEHATTGPRASEHRPWAPRACLDPSRSREEQSGRVHPGSPWDTVLPNPEEFLTRSIRPCRTRPAGL